jgi:hypothetical protein
MFLINWRDTHKSGYLSTIYYNPEHLFKAKHAFLYGYKITLYGLIFDGSSWKCDPGQLEKEEVEAPQSPDS